MNIFLIYNPIKNYTISHSVYLMHEQFNCISDEIKKKLKINIIDLSQNFNQNKIQDFKVFIKNTVFDECEKNYFLFFGRYVLSKKLLFDFELIKYLKNKGKILLWLDDLQKLFHKNVLKQKLSDPDKYLQSKTIYNIDKIITPSIIFFKNINSKLIDKTYFHFYSIYLPSFKDVIPFENRKDKILLSGYIDSSYKTRRSLLHLYNTKKKYKKWVYYHKHPGYNQGNADPTYFQTLQSFKYAFIGLVNFPMNYCISKIIETIASGTLSFIEFSPLLKEELGLIELEHYIPIYSTKNMINFNELYELRKKGLDKKIALQGRDYVLVHFDHRIKTSELIKKIKKI